MKTYREEKRIKMIWGNRKDLPKPKFKVKQCVEIYCGYNEGHSFWIADIRWNENKQKFEYLRSDPPFWVDWYTEDSLV